MSHARHRRAGDLFARRRVFLLGLGVFTVRSLLRGLAQNGGLLIAALRHAGRRRHDAGAGHRSSSGRFAVAAVEAADDVQSAGGVVGSRATAAGSTSAPRPSGWGKYWSR